MTKDDKKILHRILFTLGGIICVIGLLLSFVFGNGEFILMLLALFLLFVFYWLLRLLLWIFNC